MAQSEFAKLAGSKKYTEAWKKAREVEAFEGFAELPRGRYKVQITSAKAGVSKEKELYWLLNGVVIEGEHKGEKVSLYHSLEPTEFETKNGTMRRMDFAIMAAKLMNYEFEGSPSPAEFETISEELNESKPVVWVKVDWKDVTTLDKNKQKKTTPRCNMRIDGMIAERGGDIDVSSDEEVSDTDDSEEGDEPEEGSDTETDSDTEDSDSEGGDDEGDAKIEKGDSVLYKQNGKKVEFGVVAVNEKKGTADLKHAKSGKVIKGISLDDLELVFED